MASYMSLFIILAFVFPAFASATEFIVGDGKGWTINFDYQAWATGKDFRVGDTLVFKYPIGAHNVFKVNGTGFQNCIIPSPSEALTSGNDRIVLATPGRKWYICGVSKHCAAAGQKLLITVQPQQLTPTMPPSQSEAAYSSAHTSMALNLIHFVTLPLVAFVSVAYCSFFPSK